MLVTPGLNAQHQGWRALDRWGCAHPGRPARWYAVGRAWTDGPGLTPGRPTSLVCNRQGLDKWTQGSHLGDQPHWYAVGGAWTGGPGLTPGRPAPLVVCSRQDLTQICGTQRSCYVLPQREAPCPGRGERHPCCHGKNKAESSKHHSKCRSWMPPKDGGGSHG